MPVDQNLLRYLIAAPATMFSSNTEVPPRLFTTSATLSPKQKIDNEGNIMKNEFKNQNNDFILFFTNNINFYDNGDMMTQIIINTSVKRGN